MAFESRIAITVFKVGALLALIAPVGCDSGDEPAKGSGDSATSQVDPAVENSEDPGRESTEDFVPTRKTAPRIERRCREGLRAQSWSSARFYDGRTRLRLGYINGGNEPCVAYVGYTRDAYVARLKVAERKGEWLDLYTEHCVDVILPSLAPQRVEAADWTTPSVEDAFKLDRKERERLVAPSKQCSVVAGKSRFG